MERHRWTIAGCVVVVAISLIGWAAWSMRVRGDAAAAGGDLAQRAATADAAPNAVPPSVAPGPARDVAGSARNAAASEPLPDGTVGETHSTLVRLADAGNGPAAVRLASLMTLCATYVPKSREAAEQELVDGMAVFEPPRTDAEMREQDAMVALVLDVQDRQHTACPGFDTLGIVDPLAEQRRWTERAAALGEARAIVEMADTLIRKYKAPGDIVEHAEELRLLRPQAVALLHQAVAAGEPMALLRMAAAHRTGDLAPVDPVEAYAWMLVYRAGAPAPEIPQMAFDHALVRFEEPLDAAQRADAQQRADAIRARCCAGD